MLDREALINSVWALLPQVAHADAEMVVDFVLTHVADTLADEGIDDEADSGVILEAIAHDIWFSEESSVPKSWDDWYGTLTIDMREHYRQQAKDYLGMVGD